MLYLQEHTNIPYQQKHAVHPGIVMFPLLQVSSTLMYTPRKFVVHPVSGNIVIIETDNNVFTEKTKIEKKKAIVAVS